MPFCSCNRVRAFRLLFDNKIDIFYSLTKNLG